MSKKAPPVILSSRELSTLIILDGNVIGNCMPLQDLQEFIRFLKKINDETCYYLALYLIVVKSSMCKNLRVKSWLKTHLLFYLHFTLKFSSWFKMMECWFRAITDKRIRLGMFALVSKLIAPIKQYIENHNRNPQIIVWSSSVQRIPGKITIC